MSMHQNPIDVEPFVTPFAVAVAAPVAPRPVTLDDDAA